MKTTVVLLTTFSRSWHALGHAKRKEIEQVHLQPLIDRYADRLTIRSFNSLGYDERFSHMVTVEAADLKDYYFFIEELRDNYLMAQAYLSIERIILGYEDGYPQFDKENGTPTAGVQA
ncbi:darcynin family protein [Streptomyces cucumeris]|uniref:darcynin family protein n=1 Tax=Streptomyces cucumeris TaxID=2962890 RepID=UPI003D706FC8